MNTAISILEKLRLAYLQELPGKFNAIEKLIIELEQRGMNEETFNEVFRLVHSLKGSGGSYGVHVVTEICHPLEDLLSSLLEKPERLQLDFVDLALGYIDLLRLATTQNNAQRARFDLSAELAALRQRAFPTLLRALVVEKSAMMRGILSERLRAMQFQVEVESDGYLALGRALTTPFQVVITGLEIPRLNGLALIGALRLSQNHHGTQTILITSKRSLPGAIGAPHVVILKGEQMQQELASALEKLRSG